MGLISFGADISLHCCPSIVVHGGDIGGLYYGVVTLGQMLRLSAIEAVVCGVLVSVNC